MPWQISHLSDLNVIETVYSGWLTPVELQKASLETIALVKTFGSIRFLWDCRMLEGGHSIAINGLKAGTQPILLRPDSPTQLIDCGIAAI